MSLLGRIFRRRPLVLVICTANVCRSPLAAAVLRAELAARGSSRLCRVVSAGTSVGSPGRLPDPRMKRMAEARGMSMRGERAQSLTSTLAKKADLIVVMEERHRTDVKELLDEQCSRPAIRLLGDWFDGRTDADTDIPDPYFANAAALEMVFGQICAACGRLAADIAGNEHFFAELSEHYV